MLTRIRNAIMAGKNEVNLPHSTIKERILSQLKASGFIADYKTEQSAGGFKRLSVVIYEPGTNPRISGIERVSRPGRRLYAKADEIPKVMQGRGIVIVSTSKGVMDGEQARRQRVGGELICKVY